MVKEDRLADELFVKYLQASFIAFTLFNMWGIMKLSMLGFKMILSLLKWIIKEIVLNIRDSWVWVKETFSTKDVQG